MDAEFAAILRARCDDFAVLLRRAVREVQRADVGAARRASADLRVARGGTDRRDDLRAFLKYGFHGALALCARGGRLLRSLKRT